MNRLPQHSGTQIQIPSCPCCSASERNNWYDCPPGIQEGFTFAFCICTRCGHTRMIDETGVVPVPDELWEQMTKNFNLLYDVMYRFNVHMHRESTPPMPLKNLPAPNEPQASDMMSKPVIQPSLGVPPCIECGNLSDSVSREGAGTDRLAGGFRSGDRMCCSECGLVTLYIDGRWGLVSNEVFAKVMDTIDADDLFRMDMLGVKPHNVPVPLNPELFQEFPEPTVDNGHQAGESGPT